MTNQYSEPLSPKERISFLENKLESIVSTLENIITGNMEKAKSILIKHEDEHERKLLNCFISDSPEKPNKDYIERTYDFLKIIIEGMPFPVFLKDENGCYLLLNKQEADLFGLDESQIIGKHDSHFVSNPDQLEIIKKSDEEVLSSNKSIELPHQNFSLPNGKTYVFKTHKIPFLNPITGKINILGFSADVTDTVNLNKLKKIVIGCSNPYL